jgi:SAM-dependent methyltransferase
MIPEGTRDRGSELSLVSQFIDLASSSGNLVEMTHRQWEQAYRTAFRKLNEREPTGATDEILDRRNSFYLQLLAEAGKLESKFTLLDLGAGMSLFGPIVSELGLHVTLVDDFSGGGGVDVARRDDSLSQLELFRGRFGIQIFKQELLRTPLPLPDVSVDAVTCFHSLEHWHHSPKQLFGEIRRVLKPGGHIFLATPNAVNLRKRIYVLLGLTNHCELSEWYGSPDFRGHVREPTVSDLHQLMSWNGFEVVGTYGRNFIGTRSIALAWMSVNATQFLARASEGFLRHFPTLCSDIHVVACKR